MRHVKTHNMKLYNLTIPVMALALFGACSNSDNEFPDFDYQTVYFAKQYPVRTVELGKDNEVNTDLDNLHQVMIKAVRGGAYGNSADRHISIAIDNSLCDNLYFSAAQGGHKVLPLPADYYSIDKEEIVIPSGRIDGGLTVQLTDKFFEDPMCLANNYVIPVRMVSVEGTDSILCGRPAVDNPNRHIAGDWSVTPKDYVLYCMKYVNKYHGYYLRRGVDVITDGTNSANVIRRQQYVERDEEVNTVTTAFKECEIALHTSVDADHQYAYRLKLLFNDNGECTVSSATADATVSGTGKYVDLGEKKSIGGKDRDALYLDYTVNSGSWTVAVKDTLVMRNRGVTAEYFEVEVK